MNWQASEPTDPDKETKPTPAANHGSAGTVTIKGNHIYFFKGVDVGSVAELNQALQTVAEENLKDSVLWDREPSPIHLHIHSGGGSVFAGLAAVDAILGCRVPVHTHIDGMAASAATFISMAGHHRTIGRHGYILVHQLSSVHWGTYEELKDSMINSTVLMDRIRSFYAERGNIPKNKLDEILKHDLWWDAPTAIRYGLVDEIVGTVPGKPKKKS